MSTIPDQKSDQPQAIESPWEVLDAAQACYEMLESHSLEHDGVYSTERDRRYRNHRRKLVDGLYQHHCFKDVRGVGPHPQLIPQNREDVLPSSLAKALSDPMGWELLGRHGIASYVSDLLTALDESGVPLPDPSESATDIGAANPRDSDKVPADPVRRVPVRSTQRRLIDQRQREARNMREQGARINTIARRLKVSERTVYKDLEFSEA
jgi:hypothetical protein